MPRRPVAPAWSKGSRWFRLDPHIHAPGTLKNDHFEANWDGYLAAIESARPRVEVLGVTDYFTFQGFRELRRRQDEGQLPGVLLFPNVELRLSAKASGGSNINVHLLVDPFVPDLDDGLTSLLSKLRCINDEITYHCTEADLKRLGRDYEGKTLSDQEALREACPPPQRPHR